VDGGKFEKRGLSVITHASRLSRALVADASADRLQPLVRADVEVLHV
jgi:hypothetical protein